MKSTMIRLLAAVLSPKNPFFHSQIDWRTSSRTENNLQYFYRPVSTYRYHPPNTFRSGRAQPLKRECLELPENFETQAFGAHVARRARTAAPRPRSTPRMSPQSFVSPRRKSRGYPRYRTGLQSGRAIVREGAQRPVIRVFIRAKRVSN